MSLKYSQLSKHGCLCPNQRNASIWCRELDLIHTQIFPVCLITLSLNIQPLTLRAGHVGARQDNNYLFLAGAAAADLKLLSSFPRPGQRQEAAACTG
eukprot:1109807-Pelagomonas_calceolata.AAC.2